MPGSCRKQRPTPARDDGIASGAAADACTRRRHRGEKHRPTRARYDASCRKQQPTRARDDGIASGAAAGACTRRRHRVESGGPRVLVLGALSRARARARAREVEFTAPAMKNFNLDAILEAML